MLSWLDVERDPLADFHSLAANPVVVQVANATGLHALPQHAHEILISAVMFFVIQALTPVVTPLFYPQYKEFSPRSKHGFDTHVISQINAILVCALSLPMFFSSNLTSLTSYTPYAGMVVAYTVGYFIWDLWTTILNFKYEGLGYVAHAATALFTFSQALRPFMLNYGAPFIWFEASTPFVNVNWFAVHIPGLVSQRVKMINGLLLMIVFFLCRIVSGPLNGYKMFYEAILTPPEGIPKFSVYSVLFCYLVLVSLNFFWFAKMVKILIRTVRGTSRTKVASGSRKTI